MGTARGYATAATPPTTPTTKRLALIGARGFKGPTLVDLISGQPHLELTHVSSRQLVGYPLRGYSKASVTYSDLSVKDVERMEKDGEVDAWVMALPNGICKPFVDAIDRGAAARKGDGSVVVDLSDSLSFRRHHSLCPPIPLPP